MANVDWDSIMNGGERAERRGPRPNVRFFDAYIESYEKSLNAGRPIFDTVPSVSIQYPGMDETVRRIEPRDVERWPEKYKAYKAGNEVVTEGTPLTEWSMMPGSTLRELQYLGFKTVEQLAEAGDEIKRKLGPTGRFIKLAKDWLDAANTDQAEVVRLKQMLEREAAQRKSLEHKVELLMQRVEANEGISLRDARKEVITSDPIDPVDEVEDEDLDVEPKRRGRPRKA